MVALLKEFVEAKGVLVNYHMSIRADQAETSIEFAIDNALDRMMILEGEDHHALLNEYKEWLTPSEKQIDILVLNYEDTTKSA